MTKIEPRIAHIERNTIETKISCDINLDGSGNANINTGIGFLDHMLEQIAKHGLFDINIIANGDLHIDMHHTTEDVGIVLGQAFKKALDNKIGIVRFSDVLMPMDETLTRIALDISGRPFLKWNVKFRSPKVGNMDTELFQEWFHAFAHNAGITLHIENLYGLNAHHVIESCFKGLAKVLKTAVSLDLRAPDRLPSTKGIL
jgi:imidazoleglycerol-phosphate dehydratase